jgi:hypothetical protein
VYLGSSFLRILILFGSFTRSGGYAALIRLSDISNLVVCGSERSESPQSPLELQNHLEGHRENHPRTPKMANIPLEALKTKNTAEYNQYVS